jgi:hypothetical protein
MASSTDSTAQMTRNDLAQGGAPVEVWRTSHLYRATAEAEAEMASYLKDSRGAAVWPWGDEILCLALCCFAAMITEPTTFSYYYPGSTQEKFKAPT